MTAPTTAALPRERHRTNVGDVIVQTIEWPGNTWQTVASKNGVPIDVDTYSSGHIAKQRHQQMVRAAMRRFR